MLIKLDKKQTNHSLSPKKKFIINQLYQIKLDKKQTNHSLSPKKKFIINQLYQIKLDKKQTNHSLSPKKKFIINQLYQIKLDKKQTNHSLSPKKKFIISQLYQAFDGNQLIGVTEEIMERTAASKDSKLVNLSEDGAISFTEKRHTEGGTTSKSRVNKSAKRQTSL